MKIEMSQVWLSTPIDYLKIQECHRDIIIDSLLDIKDVSEVVHYSEILVLVDITSTTDTEALQQINRVRNDIKEAFKMFGYQ